MEPSLLRKPDQKVLLPTGLETSEKHEIKDVRDSGKSPPPHSPRACRTETRKCTVTDEEWLYRAENPQ